MAQTRITAGKWRGRLIGTPRGMDVRPTRSLVREALFNILGDEVAGSRWLDLYAGAGSVGFEALSREARSVTFVDVSRKQMALIQETAQRFDCGDACRFVVADAAAWVRRVGEAGLSDFDIVFVDAPYQDRGVIHALEGLGQSVIPLLICEHHHRQELPEQLGHLKVVRQARYGLTGLTFYRPAADETATAP